MKKIILSLLIALIASSLYADDLFKNENEFGEFFTSYYQDPHVEKIIPSIDYYVHSSLYEKVNSRMSVAHFYAHILKENPVLLHDLFENQNTRGTSDTKIFTLNILWLINNDQSKYLTEKARELWSDEPVQNIIVKMQDAPIYDVLADTPQSPADLDNLWGVFLATGNEIAVQRIISVLHLREEGTGKEIMVGGAAQWSLTSNAVQHEKVLDIVRNEAKRATGTTKRLLEEIITNAEKK